MSQSMERGNLAIEALTLAQNGPRAGQTTPVHDLPAVAAVPARIKKRDGHIVAFDADKILSAIRRAGAATGDFGADEARLLTAQVVKVLSHRFAGQIPDIERIQDVVEQALISANHFRTMRAYSVYREQRAPAAPGQENRGGRGRLGQRIPRPPGLARVGQRQPGATPSAG